MNIPLLTLLAFPVILKAVMHNSQRSNINRREFLKLAALGLGSLALRAMPRLYQLPDFPKSERLGRIFVKVDVKAKPVYDSQTVGALYDDSVVPWLHEVAGSHPYRFKQRWVEIPDGYVWASDVQPVRNLPNQPVKDLPQTSLGPGMWVEVTVPYVDVILANPPARSFWLKYRQDIQMPARLYYSQILWVDQMKTDEAGQVWYRLNERYGYGDIFWAVAEAFRPLSVEEMAPITPDVADKRVVVNVNEQFQTLSCFEANTEVYFCTVSAGKKFDPEGKQLEHSSTPMGKHYIWRKQVSTHMSGGTTGGGYDLPGIGWTTLFVGTGVAIHSTFWHNNFGGELMSHGCVNARPEDARWVFRWTQPIVPYDPGDVTVEGMTATTVEVIEK
jgi:lipoprotein-anchoring transpeptidase ErfK/SrfK